MEIGTGDFYALFCGFGSGFCILFAGRNDFVLFRFFHPVVEAVDVAVAESDESDFEFFRHNKILLYVAAFRGEKPYMFPLSVKITPAE